MESLLSILKKTEQYFAKNGVEQPRLDAELLLAHVLQCNRMQLYLNFEQPMTDSVLDALRQLVRQRANRVPLQYLVGKVDFLDFELKVDNRALIPRPETEELIELIQHRMQGREPESIVDLGTGTGVIAIALARIFPVSKVFAVDVSSEALALANENIQNLQLDSRIQLVHSNWFGSLEDSFDLIVSNPPYLDKADFEELAPEVAVHEPENALVAGPKGTECFTDILKQCSTHLKPDGCVFFEIGQSQGDILKIIALDSGYQQCVIHKDLNQKDRFAEIRA